MAKLKLVEQEYPEAELWAKCEALYDLARDLSSVADDLRQQVLSLEEDDASADMEDAIRDVLHEYPNLVVLKHPLLRKLHDSIAPGGLLSC